MQECTICEIYWGFVQEVPDCQQAMSWARHCDMAHRGELIGKVVTALSAVFLILERVREALNG